MRPRGAGLAAAREAGVLDSAMAGICPVVVDRWQCLELQTANSYSVSNQFAREGQWIARLQAQLQP